MLLSGLVYKCKCGGCNASCYGDAKHHFKVWICEHLVGIYISLKKRWKLTTTNWQQSNNTSYIAATLRPLTNFSFRPKKEMTLNLK